MKNQEKKTLTKREKMLLTIGVVSAATTGYFAYKYLGAKKELVLTKALNENNKIKDELNFIKFLVIESDCVPKALQNCANKITRKESKIKGILDRLEKHPDDESLLSSLIIHKEELEILRTQYTKTLKLDDLITNDEIIYTK